MSEEVKMTTIPNCDINATHGPAYADASLPTHRGTWAYVCKACFEDHGCGLGTGRGQRLVLRGE